MKINKIEVVFPCSVEIPEGWDQALSALVNMICENYQKDNADMVMWPDGHGSKPIWREPEEPEFDDSVYQIEVSAREDCYGQNPHNPRRDELREEAAKRRSKRCKMKRAKKKIWQSYVKELNRTVSFEKSAEQDWKTTDRKIRGIALKKGLTIRPTKTKIKKGDDLVVGFAAFNKDGDIVGEIKTKAGHREDFRKGNLSF